MRRWRWPAGVYFGTGRLLAALERWGVDVVEFDQTGPPPEGARSGLARGAVEPFPDDAGPRGGRRTPGARCRGRDGATPVHLRPLEHGADFVAPQRDEVPRRARRRPARSRRRQATTRMRPALRRLRADARDRRRAGPVLAAAPQPRDARGPRASGRPRRAREFAARLGAHRAVQIVRYPGFGGLLSFDVADGDAARRVETATERDHERDEPRRRRIR